MGCLVKRTSSAPEAVNSEQQKNPRSLKVGGVAQCDIS